MSLFPRIGLTVLALSAGLAAYAQSLYAQSPGPSPGAPDQALRVVPAPKKTWLLPATLETTQWGWFDNAQKPVLTIASGIAHPVAIKIGIRGRTAIEVLDGLAPDQPVIASPPAGLKAGDRVRMK